MIDVSGARAFWRCQTRVCVSPVGIFFVVNKKSFCLVTLCLAVAGSLFRSECIFVRIAVLCVVQSYV
jgi:hypothetical protein